MRPVPHLHLPHPNPRLLRRVPAWLRWLRQKVRGSEFSFIALAIVAGMAAGLATVLIGGIARGIQHILYGLPADVRLSGAEWLDPWRLLVLPAGGAALALFTWAVRARKRPLVDAVEANALHGGRMSKADSGVIAGQTMLSNGVGASVGLEAAYAQVGGLFGSLAGRWLSLRRADMRVLVGAGSGAAIAAAFGAPIAGAFYAFEIVIGAYTPAAIAPVAAAALAGAQVSQRLGEVPYIVHVQPGPAIHTFGYLVYAGLAAICALYGILIMRAVTLVEVRARASLPGWARPAIGGLLLVPIAAWSPQALSAGHSALHIDMMSALPVAFIAGVLLAKSLRLDRVAGLRLPRRFVLRLAVPRHADRPSVRGFPRAAGRLPDPRSGQCRAGRDGGAGGGGGGRPSRWPCWCWRRPATSASPARSSPPRSSPRRSCANCSDIHSQPGASTFAARRSRARATWGG